MTANRDADRIVRAWLDLMPEEAPDRAIASVLEAVEATPQRRPFLVGRWRLIPMTRLAIVAAVAALVVTAGSVFVLRPFGQPSVGSSPSAGRSAAPSQSPSPAPGASGVGAAVPAILRQDWQADISESLPIGPTQSRIQLSFGYDTPTAWIQTGIFSTNVAQVLNSSAVPDGPDAVRLVSTDVLGGCRLGDEGRYQWSVTGNGLYLTLTSVSDACTGRRTTLERTWVHSLAARNLGGPGVLSYFQPSIQMTFPSGSWGAGGEVDAAAVTSDIGRDFVAIKNPAGFDTPCSSTGGTHVAVQPTIAAFTAYLRSLPGVTVTSTNATIGGKPAVHLSIPTSSKTTCPGGKLYEFAPHDLTSTGFWFIRPGDLDSIWLVQVGKDLYLLQWIGDNVATAEEQQVLSTVRFIDKLPTP
jgi:hypothetical protein